MASEAHLHVVTSPKMSLVNFFNITQFTQLRKWTSTVVVADEEVEEGIPLYVFATHCGRVCRQFIVVYSWKLGFKFMNWKHVFLTTLGKLATFNLHRGFIVIAGVDIVYED